MTQDMRRYTININDKAKVIDVEAVGANEFRVRVDGRWLHVGLEDHRDLAHVAPITPSIQPRAAATAEELAPAPDASGAAETTSAPAPTASGAGASGAGASAAGASGAGGRAAPAAPAGAGAGRDKLTAPMPGVILTVDTAVGAVVKRGDALLVLEAMKMKNELRAPRDGTVAEIYVTDGQQVKYGETLVRFKEN